jgi:hypothetical protein
MMKILSARYIGEQEWVRNVKPLLFLTESTDLLNAMSGM